MHDIVVILGALGVLVAAGIQIGMPFVLLLCVTVAFLVCKVTSSTAVVVVDGAAAEEEEEENELAACVAAQAGLRADNIRGVLRDQFLTRSDVEPYLGARFWVRAGDGRIGTTLRRDDPVHAALAKWLGGGGDGAPPAYPVPLPSAPPDAARWGMEDLTASDIAAARHQMPEWMQPLVGLPPSPAALRAVATVRDAHVFAQLRAMYAAPGDAHPLSAIREALDWPLAALAPGIMHGIIAAMARYLAPPGAPKPLRLGCGARRRKPLHYTVAFVRPLRLAAALALGVPPPLAEIVVARLFGGRRHQFGR